MKKANLRRIAKEKPDKGNTALVIDFDATIKTAKSAEESIYVSNENLSNQPIAFSDGRSI